MNNRTWRMRINILHPGAKRRNGFLPSIGRFTRELGPHIRTQRNTRGNRVVLVSVSGFCKNLDTTGSFSCLFEGSGNGREEGSRLANLGSKLGLHHLMRRAGSLACWTLAGRTAACGLPRAPPPHPPSVSGSPGVPHFST